MATTISGRGKAFYVKFSGFDEMQKRLEALHGVELSEEIVEGAEEFLEAVGERSDYLCPKDTHSLVNSRRVFVERTRGRIRGAVSYGTVAGVKDPSLYAVYVHENPDAYHAPPTTWKFLEIAYAEMSRKALPMIGAHVKRALRAAR